MAKRKSRLDKLREEKTKANCDWMRWLEKLLRASNRVASLGKRVKRLDKAIVLAEQAAAEAKRLRRLQGENKPS